MYSLVLMMALSDGASLPSALPEPVTVKKAGAQELNRGRRGGCRGCWGCCGGCYGCWGCYGGWGWGCYGGGYVTYRSHYYGGVPVAGYQSYYPAQAAQPVQTAAPAQIVVDVPADARLTVDGAPTQQTSAQRVFVTPALTPGYQYNYTLKATAVRNGQTVTTTKKVPVAAGAVSRVRLDFTNREVAQR